MLLHIFLHCDPPAWRLVLPLVCTRWAALCREPSCLWETFCLDFAQEVGNPCPAPGGLPACLPAASAWPVAARGGPRACGQGSVAARAPLAPSGRPLTAPPRHAPCRHALLQSRHAAIISGAALESWMFARARAVQTLQLLRSEPVPRHVHAGGGAARYSHSLSAEAGASRLLRGMGSSLRALCIDSCGDLLGGPTLRTLGTLTALTKLELLRLPPLPVVGGARPLGTSFLRRLLLLRELRLSTHDASWLVDELAVPRFPPEVCALTRLEKLSVQSRVSAAGSGLVSAACLRPRLSTATMQRSAAWLVWAPLCHRSATAAPRPEPPPPATCWPAGRARVACRDLGAGSAARPAAVRLRAERAAARTGRAARSDGLTAQLQPAGRATGQRRAQRSAR